MIRFKLSIKKISKCCLFNFVFLFTCFQSKSFAFNHLLFFTLLNKILTYIYMPLLFISVLTQNLVKQIKRHKILVCNLHFRQLFFIVVFFITKFFQILLFIFHVISSLMTFRQILMHILVQLFFNFALDIRRFHLFQQFQNNFIVFLEGVISENQVRYIEKVEIYFLKCTLHPYLGYKIFQNCLLRFKCNLSLVQNSLNVAQVNHNRT